MPDVSMKYQKEKIVDFDKWLRHFGLEVIEGGHLTVGLSSYKTFFQLIATAETEMLIGAMRREVIMQTRIGVSVEAFWTALSKNLRFIVPHFLPNLVKDVEVAEGDEGLGTVLQFNYFPETLKNVHEIRAKLVQFASTVTYQKEKIAELDTFMHRIGLKIRRGSLESRLLSYEPNYQLTGREDQQGTLVNIKVVYEIEREETCMPEDVSKSILANMKSFETYLEKNCI
ncbi:hypothetical protein RJ640_004527 [Escallonia rubra]|uniref:Bet v I/Major latex protein domain-containing protein n=1 Tax=Escallonia rubra TaxID=112253 RepID=A0AA88UPC3_9ASTE|nr:hypothetical protein RJ640_004527 [Escallonia rubra]